MGKTHVDNKPFSYRRIVLSTGITATCAIMLVFASLPALAQSTGTPSPYWQGNGSGFGRVVQSMFGINQIASVVGSRMIEKEIRKKVSGDIDVDLDSYSASELIQGKARRLEVTGRNVVYDNAFYASDIHLITSDNTPIWVDLQTGKLKTPVEADIRIRISEEDLSRSFASAPLQKAFQNIKVQFLGGKQTIRLLQPQVTFTPERVHLNTSLGIKDRPDSEAVPLQLETGFVPEPSTGLVRLQDLYIAPIEGVSNTEILQELVEEAFQYILEPEKLLPMEQGKIEIRSLAISDNDMILEGHVRLMPKAVSSSADNNVE